MRWSEVRLPRPVIPGHLAWQCIVLRYTADPMQQSVFREMESGCLDACRSSTLRCWFTRTLELVCVLAVAWKMRVCQSALQGRARRQRKTVQGGVMAGEDLKVATSAISRWPRCRRARCCTRCCPARRASARWSRSWEFARHGFNTIFRPTAAPTPTPLPMTPPAEPTRARDQPDLRDAVLFVAGLVRCPTGARIRGTSF